MSRVHWIAPNAFVCAASLVLLWHAPPSPGSHPITAHERISVRDSALITQLARSRPGAALALMYVRLHSPETSQGMIYVEEVPSARLIAFILSHDAEIVLDYPQQPNLYSDVRIYAEVHWDIEKHDDASAILTSSVQLVYASGQPLTPVHPLEPPTQILMGRDTWRLLGPPTHL